MKQLLQHLALTAGMVLLTLLVLATRAEAAPSRETREAESFASTGGLLVLAPGSKIQYFPALRVWYSSSGTLLVCPFHGKVDIDYNKLCQVEDKKGEQAGWIPVTEATMPGFKLVAVQMSQAYKGPSLLLHWVSESSGVAKSSTR